MWLHSHHQAHSWPLEPTHNNTAVSLLLAVARHFSILIYSLTVGAVQDAEVGASVYGAELDVSIYGAELSAKSASRQRWAQDLGASNDGAELRVQILKSYL